MLIRSRMEEVVKFGTRIVLLEACQKAEIQSRTNHGVRATCVQRLRKAGVPDDQIIHITGHKTPKSLASYDSGVLDTEQHQSCQNVLTKKSVDAPAPSCSGPTSSQVTASVASTYQAQQTQMETRSLFSPGATFNNCTFNLGTNEIKAPVAAPLHRRIAVIESDPESE